MPKWYVFWPMHYYEKDVLIYLLNRILNFNRCVLLWWNFETISWLADFQGHFVYVVILFDWNCHLIRFGGYYISLTYSWAWIFRRLFSKRCTFGWKSGTKFLVRQYQAKFAKNSSRVSEGLSYLTYKIK